MKKLIAIGLLAAIAIVGVAYVAFSDPLANTTAANTTDAKEVTKEEGKELKIDQGNSSIKFLGAKVTAQHPGGFKKFSGKAVIEGDTLKQVEIDVDMDSIWTDKEDEDNAKLTGHLKTADFFDVPNHPTAKFITTELKSGVAEGQKGTHTVTGNFKLRGTTKSISFPATISLKDGKLEVDADFKINRQDWKVSFAGMQDDLIKDEVGLTLKVRAS